MSSPTWTPAALSSRARRLRAACWRLVEAQHHVSTLKLVDTLEEQAVLEALVDRAKPPVPPECRHLHYLLATPFRYGAPYPRGSRFRRAGLTPGVYYASERPATAVAEVAFHRLLFFADSPATPWPDGAAEFTAFAAEVATVKALDLLVPAAARDAARCADPVDYAAPQALADAARAAGFEAIRYASVRDPEGGRNFALLTCRAFAKAEPVSWQTWRLRIGAHGVQALCERPRARIAFGRDTFAADPRVAALAWERPPLP